MPVDVNRPGPWNHRNLTARGTRFHVALAGPEAPSGSGLLTLLIHGFPECWWTWRHVIPALAQAGHRVRPSTCAVSEARTDRRRATTW